MMPLLVEPVRLVGDQLEVELMPSAGGRMTRLRAFGIDLLRRPERLESLTEEPLLWGSYPLVPWSNRIPNGRLEFEGASHQLALNFPGHAIHGEGHAAAWTDLGGGHLEFEAGCNRGGFPWRYRAEQRFEISGTTLRQRVSLTNLDYRRMPAGIGIHPWFEVRSGLQVRIPATHVYPCRDAVPTGDPEPVAGDLDLGRLRAVPWGLDHLWTGLTGSEIELVWPGDGIRLRFGFSAAADHAILASFEDLSAVVVEAVTHATDGHARRERGERGGIDVLEPGATLTVDYSFQVERT